MTEIYRYRVGQVIGMLKITARAQNASNGGARWFVNCDCGQEGVIIDRSRLNKGQNHCGCLSRRKGQIEPGRKRVMNNKTEKTIHPVIDEFLYKRREHGTQMQSDIGDESLQPSSPLSDEVHRPPT